MEKLANKDQYVARWEWAALRTSALSPYDQLSLHLPVYLSSSPGICTCESRVMFPHCVGTTTHTELSHRSHLHKCAHTHTHAETHRYINHAVSIGWERLSRPACFSVVSVIVLETCFPFCFALISISPSSFLSTFSSVHNISLAREYMKMLPKPVPAIVRYRSANWFSQWSATEQQFILKGWQIHMAD